MVSRVLVLTTEGDSREDGNPYYCQYYLITSTGGRFKEAIFSDDNFKVYANNEAVVTAIRNLGYFVTEIDCTILTVEE